ncbi:caspase family protein [Pararhizobium sp. BT-229]|uniref:caspase family protein n=1 Tax=Pararhizobium sp. BT-229 TaxID=2986923 RepID=UPI0021F72EB5|nr:caspase family protein [Pararhizobium sp. BT-229]MCV9967522.1 caspase family protein [Pararhizobium sp. BT-229]
MFLSFGPASAAIPSGKRVALVIGNSAYKHAVELPNPKNDAKLMAETLRAAGFTVLDGENLDKAAMTVLVDQFTEIAYDAEVAIVYYAGHGLQVDGRNYLVPVDAQLEKAAQLQTRTIPADKVLAALPPDPAVSIIILDACRDNPLARTLAKALPASRSSSMGVGLAPVQANGQSTGSGGLLIAYATDPGAVAYDGKGINSPYTAALARHLTTPGLEIQSALTRVRADVSEATGGAQRPWHNASLSREVFIGGDLKAEVQAQVPATEAKPAGDTAAASGASEVNWTVEQKLWEEASKRNTVAHYELYLQQYPSGNFATLAKLNLDQLKAVDTTEVASITPAGEASASASQVRTAVAIPDDVKLTVGTPETEATLNLDRESRIDLQLRLGALGHVTGGADGALGTKSRNAIGSWQRQNGLVETTYLTQQQHMFLVVQTDPMMPQIRAQYESQKAAIANRKAQQWQQREKPTAQRNYKKQRNGAVLEGRVRRNNPDPAGAAFMGGLIGGALGGIIGSR